LKQEARAENFGPAEAIFTATNHMQRYTGRLASLVFGVVRRKDTVEGALCLHKLCVGGACFSVILDMRFSCLRSVVHCVFMVTMGYVCVMRGS
jgi:hypothetical protein